MRYPLWEPSNVSEVSSLFVVHPGKCVLLAATGLSEYVTQTEAGFRAPQMVCVERLLFEFTKAALKPAGCDCDWIFNPSASMAKGVMDDTVAVGKCYWTLSLCDNMGIVGLPGAYRLRLNDPTAVGTVQVYAELFDTSQIPSQMTSIFFQ